MNQSLLFRIQHDIALLILDKLEKEQITEERAAAIAKFTLSVLPPTITDEQIIKILPSLDDEYIELASVVQKFMNDFERQYEKKISSQAEDLIKHHHFTEAKKLMSDYFAKKVLV